MKIIFIAILFFMAGLSVTYFISDIQALLGEVPPTNAFAGFNINDNATYSTTNATQVLATSYRDLPWLLSDGSINIEITSYP